MELWWTLVGAAIPAIVAGKFMRVKKRSSEEQKLKIVRGREKSSDDIFVCERVCTSKRMLNKVGAFSKDPTPNSCVTVCGVSELDACAEACARTVCVNQHQVPNWNDICLRRCQSKSIKKIVHIMISDEILDLSSKQKQVCLLRIEIMIFFLSIILLLITSLLSLSNK